MIGKCTKCGASIDRNIMFTPTGVVCELCKFRSNPPTMRLVILENGVGKPLYNMTQKVYECRMRIEDFEKCGWFIRERSERSGFTFFKMEFYGTARCVRFPNADYPLMFYNCTKSIGCKNQTVQELIPVFTENYIG